MKALCQIWGFFDAWFVGLLPVRTFKHRIYLDVVVWVCVCSVCLVSFLLLSLAELFNCIWHSLNALLKQRLCHFLGFQIVLHLLVLVIKKNCFILKCLLNNLLVHIFVKINHLDSISFFQISLWLFLKFEEINHRLFAFINWWVIA